MVASTYDVCRSRNLRNNESPSFSRYKLTRVCLDGIHTGIRVGITRDEWVEERPRVGAAGRLE